MKIWGGADDTGDAPALIEGEVTAIEADIHRNVTYTTIRGYEKAHRMQRVRRTYVYRNMKDSDIAQQMALKYGLLTAPPQIDSTNGVHDALAQFNQTDWEFLKCRAAENGYDFGVVQGSFVFRKPKSTGDTPMFLGLFPLPGGPPTLTAGDNLLHFRPRVTASGQVPKVMVRSWDPTQKDAIVGRADADTKQIDLDDIDGASDLFDKFMLPPRIPDIPIPVLIPGTGASIDWGVKEALPTSVNGDVYAIVDRPLSNSGEADGMAKSVAEHVASTFAEAEGTCEGNPLVQAGITVIDRQHARLLLRQVGGDERPPRLRRGQSALVVPHALHRQRPPGAFDARPDLARAEQRGRRRAAADRRRRSGDRRRQQRPELAGPGPARVPVAGRQLRVGLVPRRCRWAWGRRAAGC